MAQFVLGYTDGTGLHLCDGLDEMPPAPTVYAPLNPGNYAGADRGHLVFMVPTQLLDGVLTVAGSLPAQVPGYGDSFGDNFGG